MNKIFLYKQKKYCVLNNLINFNQLLETINIQELGELIEIQSELKETDDYFILDLYRLNFNLIDDIINITKYKYKTIKINKENKISEVILFDKCFTEQFNENELKFIYDKNDLFTLINSLVNLNINMINFMNTKKIYESIMISNYSFLNFINSLLFYYNPLEKLITSNNLNLFIKNIYKDDFNVFLDSNKEKLHQIVGFPKFAIPLIKTSKLEIHTELLQELNKLCNGNDFKVFLEFMINLKNFRNLDKTSDDEDFITKTILLIKKSYRMVDLLNYLLRQSYFYNLKHFKFPIDEINWLSDYVDMCELNELKYEKYPSFLKKQHDIVASNIESMNVPDSLMYLYEEAVICYENVCKTIKYEDQSYIFIIPKTIKDLIEEGNNLHHCVGSYYKKIINKESFIVFMRKLECPKESYITIDLKRTIHEKNITYDIKEAKQMFDSKISAYDEKIINKWLKEINK